MTITDKTQLARQFAIVDMIRELPTALAWTGVSELPIDAQDDLYDFLKAIEDERGGRCEVCRKPLDEDDADLCGACADRSEQLMNMAQMQARSGVVFGERL